MLHAKIRREATFAIRWFIGYGVHEKLPISRPKKEPFLVAANEVLASPIHAISAATGLRGEVSTSRQIGTAAANVQSGDQDVGKISCPRPLEYTVCPWGDWLAGGPICVE